MSFNDKYRVALSSHSFCFICKWPNTYVKLHKVKKSSISFALREHNIIIKEDIYYLDDKVCEEITGWSKEKFIQFCSYIKSLNRTKKRTKEQLVALYRFWLRKGLNEKIISQMFGKESSQQKISNYLDQIRNAIYKDFVPHFLGSKKDRSFFLNHNNLMTVKLHDLAEDVLVIVVDGTYCRLEKSSNNEFQYASWSEQKKDLLIKPFLIICADGWIIDCYGPFKANQNDAKIFEFILNTDKDLMNILINGKTAVFLDRAFRDLYQKLTKDFGFLVKIPTCNQLESDEENDSSTKKLTNQLTTKQTTETRFVTKCRFIVEKQIGNIKKFASLDNIRNRQAGHIQIDYRIACSMINFGHKSCCPDGDNAIKIAERLKKKAEKENNNLEILLRKHLTGTAAIKKIDISSIDDFPMLSKKKLIGRVFLGTYQIRLCKSYLGDILKNGIAYQVSESLLKSLFKKNNEQFFKIIGIEIPSRHTRSKIDEKDRTTDEYMKGFKKRYKVFLHYLPGLNNTKAILGYICTCKSGKKVVGCCVHVATLIYYLAYARFHNIQIPADNLNSIFIKMKDNEAANKPRYVRFNRLKKYTIVDSINKNSDSESSLDQDIQTKKKFSTLEKESSVISDNNPTNENMQKINLEYFIRHVPFWGGNISYNNKKVRLINTCTIDYFLFCFWYASKINSSFIVRLPALQHTESIKEIILWIEEINWNKAKETWVCKVAKYTSFTENNELDLFGSHNQQLMVFLNEYQKHKLIQKCKIECLMNNNTILREESDRIFFKEINNQINLYSFYTGKCSLCGEEIIPEIQFDYNPNFLLIESAFERIHFNDLPKTLIIDNKTYQFLCVTISEPGHFIGIFEVNNSFYRVNDSGQHVSKIKDSSNKRRSVSTSVSFYYLV